MVEKSAATVATPKKKLEDVDKITATAKVQKEKFKVTQGM